MASSSIPARFTTRSIPNLLQDEGSCAPTSDSRLSHEKVVMEAFQVAALAHISTPAWGGFRGFAPVRFEVEKVPARRGVRYLLGTAPGGSGKLAFETETCATAPTTPNGALVTVQPVADNSLVRRTLADRAAKQLSEERWMAGSRHSERHFVNKNGHRIYTQQWLPDGTPMKAVVVVLHGLNEHSGRYKHLAKELTRKGYGVFGMDWYGVKRGFRLLLEQTQAGHAA